LLGSLALFACKGEVIGPSAGRDGGFGRDTGEAGCGNEEIEGLEICDDGNTMDGDGCSANCASTERCGNAYIDEPLGETCDDGNSSNGDGCSADCRSDETCGNTVVDLGVGEVCDDGNTIDGDGCSADCRTGPTCGDGIPHGGEACDDGNTEGGDGCSADCRSDETCGNTVTDPGEECDDGNDDGGDGCSEDCAIERCGNGAIEGAEACDDGNVIDGDGCEGDCTFTCTTAAECDDAMPCNGAETCGGAHVCGAGTPPSPGTDCGGGMVCRGGACVAPACGNMIREASEQCDDGDSEDGDGCDNDCTFSCTADPGCNDGNACNGTETCNLASHACTNPMDLADGTGCGGGMVCRGGSCVASACGNRIVEAPEQCDDGNMVEGDGCDNDCTFSCTVAADCADANPCNGPETCNAGMHRCQAGTPPAAGSACDRDMNPMTRDICRTGMCLASRCGDGFVDAGAGESCEDGNMVNGDGCDNDCTYSCAVAADCTDGLPCNGTESCNTTSHRCTAGAPPANGTACDRDMMPATRDICLTSSCVLSRCGDGFRDTGAMPPEACDDGNVIAGDGCEPTCTPTGAVATAFRVVTLDLMDPHVYISLFGCRDVTDSPLLGFSVNGEIQTNVDDYVINYLTVHRPLSLAGTNPLDIVDGECTAGSPPMCAVGMGVTYPTAATNRPAGMTCYTPDASTLTASYPDPSTVTGPCFVTDPRSIVVSISGTPVPLSDARVAATYSGGVPPTMLVSGVISGFLSETDARAARLADTLPLVGGDTLYEHLAAGGASGSSCASGNDRDTHMGVVGFWFYLNFTAAPASWSGP
jgi:cysteine-rich repeat protein